MTRTEGDDARPGGECAHDPSVVAADEAFFRTLVESASDVILAVDETGAIVFANPAIEETFGYDPEALIGRSVTAFVPRDQRPEIRAAFETLRSAPTPPGEWEGIETVGRHRDGRLVPVELSLRAHRDDDRWLLTAVVRDISDRQAERIERRREQDLTEQLLRTVPTGLVVLSAEGVIERMNDRAGEILGVDPADVLGDSRDTDAWRLLDAGGEPVPPDERVFQLARDSGRPVTEVEQQVERADGERVWVQVSAAPLADGTDTDRVVVVVEDISRQKARQRRLREQNDQLERLDRINAVIRGIDQALVRATTRREIDEAVCEALAAADPYHSAWIGDVGASSDEVTPRASGGDVADYLDAIAVTRSAEPGGTGPAGRAIRSRSVQVTHDVETDAAFEGVRAVAAAHGIRSAASVPLVYDGTIYGVLTVYADEPGAFDGTEQDVLAELGATIGHAINAVTTRQALVADRVTELRLAIDDDHFFAALSAALDCEVAFEGATVQADETFRYYLTVAGAAPDDVLAFAEAFAGVESARIVSVGPEGESLLEATLEAESAFGVVADHGGAVRSATATDGQCEVVAQLPVSAKVRAVVDALGEAFDGIEVRAQHDRARGEGDAVTSGPSFDAELTDRQRTAVETAYYAGFFEWPRESTGEEIAESLGVSAPTFHKHLRIAERKLLAAQFDGSPHRH